MSHFEIVRTAHEQFHARFVSANGRLIWWTENYRRKIGAEKAIAAVRRTLGSGVEVHYVDDRLKPLKRPELPTLNGAAS